MFKSRLARAIASVLLVVGIGVGASACSTDADTVNENLSTQAEQFQVQRTIVFYNGITEAYIAVIEGRCSVERPDGRFVQAICKVGPNEFTRDEIGLSDNVTYFVLQTKAVDASEYHKKIVLKPAATLPDFDVEVGEK